MAQQTHKTEKKSTKSRRKASSPEAREAQIIAAAVDRAEQQILDGTASPSVITHYLKLGTAKARMEERILESQIRLNEARIEALKSASTMEELYRDAMRAFTDYRGDSDE